MNPLKKLKEPLKKFEHLFTNLLHKLEKIPTEVLHLGEHFTKDLPLTEFAEHFHDIKYDGIDGFVEKSIMTVLNELAEKTLYELREIGEEALTEFKKFSGHVMDAVNEVKKVGHQRIHECIEAFKNAIVSVPEFIKEEKENIEDVLKSIPHIKGAKSLERTLEKVEKVVTSVEVELKKLVEPVKALANLLADFIQIIIKLVAEEIREMGTLLVEALRKINRFLQGIGDRVQIVMNPPGWTSIFLKINMEQVAEIRESFGTIQNAVDLDVICNAIETTMEFLSGNEGLADKVGLLVEGLRKGVLHVDDMIEDFDHINDVVRFIEKELELIKKAEHLAEEGLHLAENVGKEAIKDAKVLVKGVEKGLSALSGLFHKKKKK